MKRVLLLVSFLWIIGLVLYAQNTGTAGSGASRGPWAQVTVTPSPQGGPPAVNSYISPWPLGTVLQDSFSGLQNPVIGGNSAQPLARQATGEDEQAWSTIQTTDQTTDQNMDQTTTQPAAQAATGPATSQTGAASSDSPKRVVVPSPVHYDRAGRRVIEPGWQDTLAQIVRSEREAGEGAGADPGETGDTQPAADAQPAADTQPAARETIIVVPGPAKWRIRGTLTVAKGMLALDGNDGVLWYLPGLDRYIGFIDGLDAGEEAILEGYAPALGSSQERYFQPTSLIIDDMNYDLSIPPYGLAVQPYLTNPAIREASPVTEAAKAAASPDTGARTNQNGGQAAQEPAREAAGEPRDRNPWSRRTPPQPPAWQHNHKSPWAPPTSVLDFEMDYDSFWQEDPARQERRERDSREIWY
jgi:hypothetical protein